MMRIIRRVLSAIVVLLGFAAGAALLRWLTAGSWSAIRVENPSFDALLIFGVGVLAWACYVWLALGMVLTALSALPGAVGSACGLLAERITPAVYRRAARLALGMSVAAGPVVGALPAYAAPADQPTGAAAAAQLLPSVDRPGALDRAGTVDAGLPAGTRLPNIDRPGSLDRPSHASPTQAEQRERAAGLPIVEWPGSPNRTDSGRSTAQVGPELPNPDRPRSSQPSSDPIARIPVREPQHVREVVVKRGDNLWNIAKAHLPEGASDAEIDREWRRWYDANRDVIGDDPDLILPGQVLRPPQD